MRHDCNITPERTNWSQRATVASVPLGALSWSSKAVAVSATSTTWVAATGIAAAMHIGVYMAFGIASTAPTPPDPAPVALMVDMMPMSVSQSAVDNADQGPESIAADAMSEMLPPPKLAQTPEDLPVLPETPPDAVSEAFLPEVKKAETPPEQPPERKEPEQEPEKKEPPKQVEKTQIKQAAAKNSGGPKAQGTAVRTSSANPSWLADVRGRMVRAKIYPAEARSQGRTGSVLVAVTIAASGQLVSASLVSSSRVPALDAEALATMRRAAPYPPTPDGRPTTVRIPIVFNGR